MSDVYAGCRCGYCCTRCGALVVNAHDCRAVTPPDAVWLLDAWDAEPCDDCQAEPFEPCRPDCLGLATDLDLPGPVTPPDAVQPSRRPRATAPVRPSEGLARLARLATFTAVLAAPYALYCYAWSTL